MRTTQTRWLDLGELGQYEAEIVANIHTNFPHVESIKVSAKGETVQLAHLIGKELESEILADLEVDDNMAERVA